ncbi:hypothetical protein Hhel01_03103 [Haloferula helveola]
MREFDNKMLNSEIDRLVMHPDPAKKPVFDAAGLVDVWINRVSGQYRSDLGNQPRRHLHLRRTPRHGGDRVLRSFP